MSSVQVRPSDWQAGLSLGQSLTYAYDNEVACDVLFHLSGGPGRQRSRAGDATGARGGGGEVTEARAHRLILSLRSPVFFAMFNGPLKQEDEKDSIDITDVEPAAFKELLNFIYKEEANITSSNAVQTLYAAKKYLIPGLANQCSDFLERSILLDNVCLLLEQGIQVDEKSLVDRCLQLVMAKTDVVLSSTHWQYLSNEAVSAILDCPNLSVGELVVFQGLVTWCTAQCQAEKKPPVPANLREKLGDLLYKINMVNLSLKEFSEHVVPSGLLTDSEELSVFKQLTNPSALKQHTPFASGRQNCLMLLKPLHILDQDSQGECNFDSVGFTFTLTVHSPMRLVELHLYDLLGPHVISITIKSKSSAGSSNSGSSTTEMPSSSLGYSVKDLTHQRQYDENNQRVFVFHLGKSVNLCHTTYELVLTLLGEFDTFLYDRLQFGDKHLSVSRGEKESPLFGLGYKLEDPDAQNPRPAVGKLQASHDKSESKHSTEQARKISAGAGHKASPKHSPKMSRK